MKAELRADLVWFWCAGCETHHAIDPTRWTWNGDSEKPTFSPSILVTGYVMSERGYQQLAEHLSLPVEKRPPHDRFDGNDSVCHSFVKDGMIEYLTDCTHALSGQTLPLEELP